MKTISMLLIAAFSILSFTTIAQDKAGKKDTASHTTYYTCPMHDSIMVTKAGYCPVCGMKLQLSNKEQMKYNVMKTYTGPVHADVKSDKAGKCPKCGMQLTNNLSPKEKMKTVFSCPMHPDVTSDKEGKCPKCGMTLTKPKS
jgi:uncharacterized paraquat-inducible protein A